VDCCIVAFRGRIGPEIAIRASRLDTCFEYQMRNFLSLFNRSFRGCSLQPKYSRFPKDASQVQVHETCLGTCA
jgi:hypothetical protein